MFPSPVIIYYQVKIDINHKYYLPILIKTYYQAYHNSEWERWHSGVAFLAVTAGPKSSCRIHFFYWELKSVNMQ